MNLPIAPAFHSRIALERADAHSGAAIIRILAAVAISSAIRTAGLLLQNELSAPGESQAIRFLAVGNQQLDLTLQQIFGAYGSQVAPGIAGRSSRRRSWIERGFVVSHSFGR